MKVCFAESWRGIRTRTECLQSANASLLSNFTIEEGVIGQEIPKVGKVRIADLQHSLSLKPLRPCGETARDTQRHGGACGGIKIRRVAVGGAYPCGGQPVEAERVAQ